MVKRLEGTSDVRKVAYLGQLWAVFGDSPQNESGGLFVKP